MSGGSTNPDGAIDLPLRALSRKLHDLNDEFEGFHSVTFAADSNYPPGQRSLTGWTRHLTDTFSDVLLTLDEGINKVINRQSLTRHERRILLDAIDEYKIIQAHHPIAKATKKPPVGVSTDSVQVTIPNLDFAPLIARLGMEGRFQTTALV